MIDPIIEIKNFYDDDIKKQLNNWSIVNYKDPDLFIEGGNNPYGTMFTTRWSEKEIKFPDAAYELRERFVKVLNLKDFKYRYGIGISNYVCFPGCEIFEHTDDKIIPGYITYHCNIVTKKPQGGETVIEGKTYDIDENDVLCYAVSKLSHKVNLVTGTRLRIMWSFAYHIPEYYFNSSNE